MSSGDNPDVTPDIVAATTQPVNTPATATAAAAAAAHTHAVDGSSTVDTPTCYFLDYLPRELRDMIYAFLGHNSTLREGIEGAPSVRLKDGPRLSILLVSKQVHAEYRSECEKIATLLFTDVFDMNIRASAPRFQTRFEAKKAHALLIAQCESCSSHIEHTADICSLLNDLDDHRSWLSSCMKQLPKTADLTIKIQFPCKWELYEEGVKDFAAWPDSPCLQELPEKLKLLTQIPRLIKITAVGHPYCFIANAARIPADKTGRSQTHRYACWTKANGWEDMGGDLPNGRRAQVLDYDELDGLEYTAE
ncbi:hypothetical protein AC578_8023 [Pseudocercospora eumusae]|uniref:Uncharacterized protein n=1 Tax=Pseudocercospora eumusae TaxID=321146 RepID=A0A139HGQ2_9PEZI|nr:hypothetical protein AC578_8023 [Pseudocercospora eumusae]